MKTYSLPADIVVAMNTARKEMLIPLRTALREGTRKLSTEELDGFLDLLGDVIVHNYEMSQHITDCHTNTFNVADLVYGIRKVVDEVHTITQLQAKAVKNYEEKQKAENYEDDNAAVSDERGKGAPKNPAAGKGARRDNPRLPRRR